MFVDFLYVLFGEMSIHIFCPLKKKKSVCLSVWSCNNLMFLLASVRLMRGS